MSPTDSGEPNENGHKPEAEMTMTAQEILREARKRHGLTQIQMGMMLCMSVEQVKRIEYGAVVPEFSDVDRMEEGLPEPGLFRRWARAQYPEIVKYFGEADDAPVGLMGSIVNTRHSLGDVLRLQERVERDAIDGRIDDMALRQAYREELEDARDAIEASLDALREDRRRRR